MRIIALFLITMWPFVFFAKDSNDRSYFTQLCEINKQWLKHEQDCPNKQVYFETDQDAIQTHLLLVCNSLKINTPTNLNKNQLESRLKLIRELREYALQKVFPTNLYHAERTPYFVDDFGVHCAVGYLMSQSGSKDLVSEIRANENYSYIADIKTPGVSEWAIDHGFTIDELKWIQPAYSPSPHLVNAVGNGANGPVNKIINNGYNGELVIAGEFDSLDKSPCLNIGIYRDKQLSCLGNGVSGKINDIGIDDGKIVAFGALEYQNSTYTMAFFDNGIWNYTNIPTREGVVATAGFTAGQGMIVALNHPTDENVQEIWIQSISGTWEKDLTLNGVVKKIGASSLGRVFVGKFNEAITYDEQGAVNDTVYTNNVLFRENYGNHEWEGINGTEISDTVNTLVVVYGQIYFGGTASKDSASSGVILTRYLNNTLQPILFTSWFSGSDTVSINSIDRSQTDGSLLIGGDFYYEPMMGTSGKNLANYDVFSNTLSLIAHLDERVNTAVLFSGQIYFGGDFQTNLSTTQLNHLGKFDATSGMVNDSFESSLKVFPNPFTDVIEIEGANTTHAYQILDGRGGVVRNGSFDSDVTIDLRDLSNGVYLLNMQTENGMFSKRLIKQ